jgi:hypothetical protein
VRVQRLRQTCCTDFQHHRLTCATVSGRRYALRAECRSSGVTDLVPWQSLHRDGSIHYPGPGNSLTKSLMCQITGGFGLPVNPLHSRICHRWLALPAGQTHEATYIVRDGIHRYVTPALANRTDYRFQGRRRPYYWGIRPPVSGIVGIGLLQAKVSFPVFSTAQIEPHLASGGWCGGLSVI